MVEHTWMAARNARLDRSEALFEALHQKHNHSQSSPHGAENSFTDTRRQPYQSKPISPIAEASREINQRITESSRAIKQSLTRMIALLQEEIDASELLNQTIPASNEFSPSTEQPPSHSEKNLMVDVANPTGDVNGESMNLSEAITKATTESLGISKIVVAPSVNDDDLVVHGTSPLREIQLAQIGAEVTNSQAKRRSIGPAEGEKKSDIPDNPTPTPSQTPPPPKPPDRCFLKTIMEFKATGESTMPPPPPEPPDRRCYLVACAD